LKKELKEEQKKQEAYDKESKVKSESLIKQQANIEKSQIGYERTNKKVKKLNALKAN